jgi:hypothetical protein
MDEIIAGMIDGKSEPRMGEIEESLRTIFSARAKHSCLEEYC